MRVWITGYAGFIGRHVIEELATRSVAVAGIGNARAEPPLPPNRRIDGQVSELRLEMLADLVGTPDVIIHLAGGSSVGPSFSDPAADRDRTVGSTNELLTWLSHRSLKPRLVVASSAAVYGSGHDGPIPETAATLPVSPYGRHKLMMEDCVSEMARRHEIPAIIVRLFSVYGRGLTKQFFYDLCGRVKMGKSPIVLAGTGEETRDYLHGRDAAALLWAASEHAEPKVPVVNGGSGVASSIAATAELVASAWLDRFGCPLQFEFSRDVRPGDPRSLVADVNRIASWGFRPDVSLHSGIADYVGWFIEVILRIIRVGMLMAASAPARANALDDAAATNDADVTDNPRFSIITATLNRREMLARAIESVHYQRWPRVQHIVVDGGSTDGTLEFLASLETVQIIPGPDRGVYDAFNKGIAVADGDLVGFLNSDDVYEPGAFAAVAAFARARPKFDAYAGNTILEDPTGRVLRSYNQPRELDLTARTALIEACLTNARFFRREALLSVGPFSLAYPLAADREFLVRWLSAGLTTAIVDQPVYRYLAHEASLTFSSDRSASLRLRRELLALARSCRRQPGMTGDLRRVARLLEGRCLGLLAVHALRERHWDEFRDLLMSGGLASGLVASIVAIVDKYSLAARRH